MLRNAIENYLKSVSEINFFSFFQCILEKKGYSDIHFTHGNIEFGKDFICKKNNIQFAIQVKAKDIDLNIFRREVTPQLIQAITQKSSHPNLDIDIDYRVIFVTTGRLNSPTQAAFTQFNNYVEKTLNSNKVECWDFDTLIKDIFSSSVEQYLYDNAESSKIVNFFKMLSITEGDEELDWYIIEKYTYDWLSDSEYNRNEINILLESSLFVHILLKNENFYYAIVFQIGLYRFLKKYNLIEKYKDSYDTNLKDLIKAGIEYYNKGYKKRESLALTKGSEISFFEYPKNCLRFGEILSLDILLFDEQKSIMRIKELIIEEPGIVYTISDNYMTSLFLISLALIKTDNFDLLKKYINNLTLFICDRYQDIGLCTVGANSSMEVAQIISEYLDGFEYIHNKSSQIAGLLLYIAHKFFDSGFYKEISNELKSVDITLSYIHVIEDDATFTYEHDAIFQTFDSYYSLEKAEKYSTPIFSEINKTKISGSIYELLLSSFLLRDRFYIKCFEEISTKIGTIIKIV